MLNTYLGQLPQGNHAEVESTDTIDFFPISSVSNDKEVTYSSFMYEQKLFKEEQYRICISVRGD